MLLRYVDLLYVRFKSALNIAGICNVDRNIFGMMPHPERAADRELCNQDGRVLFESILNKVLL